jgi:hypothetical protein
MRFKSRRPKPATGMELTVTLSMPADQSVEQSAASIVQFFDGLLSLSAATGAAWVNVRCAGIPVELESRLQAALDQANAPRLKLVVDNG